MSTVAHRRFTAEQVIAVIEAVDQPAPMTARDIARGVRAAHGVDPGRTTPPFYSDIRGALAELVQTGRLVTSRAPGWRQGWHGTDEQHAYLIQPGNRIERFYATPDKAAAWKSKREGDERIEARARNVASAITRTLGGQAVVIVEHEGQPKIRIDLTLDQVARLFGIGA